MNIVYFSLGSNLGDRTNNLINAIGLLKANGINILRISNLYETEPIGIKEQPFFYNICIKAETQRSPEELLDIIADVEKQVGREKTVKWGPRIIDVDILFYSNIIMNTVGLIVPHPEIEKRAFVLLPLSRICGDFIHPVLHKSISQLLLDGNFNEKIKDLGEFSG